MKAQTEFAVSCPLPISDYPKILLAHGGGGRLMNKLIEQVFVAGFNNDLLSERHDGSVFDVRDARLAFTTDSYVVKPLFFPGGDIGSLAVNGTVNDLAMCGARPLYLSAGFILEEGMDTAKLWQIVQSMKQSADQAGVLLVTGDTKVVDRGKGDEIFINTAGVGVIDHDLVIGPRQVRPGDTVILSGDIGRHGIAIMAAREGLEFETAIESDCQELASAVQRLLDDGIEIHCLRDLTRGGLASALVEIAESSGLQITVAETEIKVREEVRGACEILGFDPMYLANEGRFVAFVPDGAADRTLELLNSMPGDERATKIGTVSDGAAGVLLSSVIGSTRIVDMFSGEQLPRIC
jgi:hydrogenase expression/formation protein HypE